MPSRCVHAMRRLLRADPSRDGIYEASQSIKNIQCFLKNDTYILKGIFWSPGLKPKGEKYVVQRPCILAAFFDERQLVAWRPEPSRIRRTASRGLLALASSVGNTFAITHCCFRKRGCPAFNNS